MEDETSSGQALAELAQFLTVDQRADVKAAALKHVLGLTGSELGRRQLLACPALLTCLKHLTSADPSPAAHDALLALLNLSSSPGAADTLLSCPGPELAGLLLSEAVRPDSQLSDAACMTLSNISRELAAVRRLWPQLRDGPVTLQVLVCAMCQTGHSTAGQRLDYIAPLLSNVTQLPEARQCLLDRDRVVFERLLPFTEYPPSLVRRGGVVGAIKNCCFDTASHGWLLGPAVDLAPRLLLPLAGSEPFSEEETESLAVDLQYLEDDKQREPDPDIRRMLLEALTQLCVTRAGRETVRSKGAYLVLREYHKWEDEPEAVGLCQLLVNILIKTEQEIGVDDYSAVQVPADVADRLDKESAPDSTRAPS